MDSYCKENYGHKMSNEDRVKEMTYFFQQILCLFMGAAVLAVDTAEFRLIPDEAITNGLFIEACSLSVALVQLIYK